MTLARNPSYPGRFRGNLELVELLLSDLEPTASLDQDNVLAAEALIERYRVGMQAIVLWVSHNVDQIRRVSQRHFVMRGGQLTEVPVR